MIRKVSDEQILSALACSETVTLAAARLGVTRSSVSYRCETGELAIAYIDCAKRGRKLSGPTSRNEDATILMALSMAQSTRKAARLLGVARTSLKTRCMNHPVLRSAFEECRSRGLQLVPRRAA
jgi:transcriptional regulator with PAS, ATPase and Fis domain